MEEEKTYCYWCREELNQLDIFFNMGFGFVCDNCISEEERKEHYDEKE